MKTTKSGSVLSLPSLSLDTLEVKLGSRWAHLFPSIIPNFRHSRYMFLRTLSLVARRDLSGYHVPQSNCLSRHTRGLDGPKCQTLQEKGAADYFTYQTCLLT